MSAFVRQERIGGVIHLVLDRAERKNALDLGMYEALTAGLEAATADPTVTAVVLRGEGGAFCAGNDMQDFLKHPPTGDDSPVFRFLHAVVTFTKPLVVGVQGAAVGIGTTVLLHADLVYAAPDAKFKMPFVQLGVVPEAGSSLLVPALVGHRVAAELLLLGKGFGAEDALRWGFVNGIVPAERLVDHVTEVAARFDALPSEAVVASKALLRRPHREAVRETLGAESAIFIERLASPEAREAISAFLEKRLPDFAKLRGA